MLQFQNSFFLNPKIFKPMFFCKIKPPCFPKLQNNLFVRMNHSSLKCVTKFTNCSQTTLCFILWLNLNSFLTPCSSCSNWPWVNDVLLPFIFWPQHMQPAQMPPEPDHGVTNSFPHGQLNNTHSGRFFNKWLSQRTIFFHWLFSHVWFF